MKIATEKVQKLQLGSHTHSKKYAKRRPKEVSDKLELAQKLQEEKEQEFVKTPTRKGKRSSDSDTPVRKSRYGRTIKSTFGKLSETPMTKGRRLGMRKITQSTERFSPRSKVKAKLLVTESITVACPYQDRIYVLNRGDGVSFEAHFKGDKKAKGTVKRTRTHWASENVGKRLWRKSANKEGNNPLHQAVIDKEMDFIKYFSQFENLDKPNHNGDHPIHLACEVADLKVLELLCDKMPKSLKSFDSDGNTVLHLLCNADNIEAAELLIRKGVELNVKNKKGETSKSLITKHKNKKWNALFNQGYDLKLK